MKKLFPLLVLLAITPASAFAQGVLYPSTKHPSTEISVFFASPENAQASDYCHWFTQSGGGCPVVGIFNLPGVTTYITGATQTVPLANTSADFASAYTIFDDSASGSTCPSFTFGTSNSPDVVFNAVTAANSALINNLIISAASYTNNSATPIFWGTQNWANTLEFNCVTRDPAMTWQATAWYLPGSYVYVGALSTYFQMQKTTCSNTSGGNIDSNDIRCLSGSSAPTWGTSCGTLGSTCNDGSGGNLAVWTNMGSNAPVQDFWCDANSTGLQQYNCYQLQLVGAASITTNTATVTVANPPSFPSTSGLAVTGAQSNGTVNTSGTAVTWVSGSQFSTSMTGAIIIGGTTYTLSSCSSATSCTLTTSAGTRTGAAYTYNATAFNCANATVTGETATTVSYTCAIPLTSTFNSLALTCPSSSACGNATEAHSLNINSFSWMTEAIVANQQPVTWEQPFRLGIERYFNKIATHYTTTGNPSLGYIRMGCTKAGECNQSNITGWPCGSASTTCSSAVSTKLYVSYEKELYCFMGGVCPAGGTQQPGTSSVNCGQTSPASFACVGNLNTSPSIEGPYMQANNIGGDNNAIGTDHAYTLDYYQVLGDAYPPAGKLRNGGDWALEFATTFGVALPNTYFPVNVLQTTQEGTPGSNPGNCNTGGCSGGSCSSSGQTGALSADPFCTTNLTVFPLPNAYPGILPLMTQYQANAIEMYPCDVRVALDTAYNSNGCLTLYDQAVYQPLYKAAMINFLAGTTSAPTFTTASAVTFLLNAVATPFNCGAASTPLASFTETGSMPTGLSFTDNGNGTCSISGTPTSAGSTTITINAANAVSTTHQSFTINVSSFNKQGLGSGSGEFVLYAALCSPGAPFFNCTTTNQSYSVGALTALFISTAPTATTCSGACQNSVAYDTTLNPSGTNPVTRMTDGTVFPSGKSVGNGTCTGGDNDLMASVNDDFIAALASGGITYIQAITKSSSGIQVVNTGTPAVHITCPVAFSRLTDNKVWTVSTAGELEYYTIAANAASATGPTSVFNFLSGCPGIPASFTSLSGTGIFRGNYNDTRFNILVQPNSTVQNTAYWEAVYDTSLGCSTINYNSGQVWGWCTSSCSPTTTPLGTLAATGDTCYGAEPTGSGGGIHDAMLSVNGDSVFSTMNGTWTIGACAGSASNNQFISWVPGTLTETWCDDAASPTSAGQCGSHSAVGTNLLYTPYGVGPNVRAVSNLASTPTIILTPPSPEWTDIHQAWPDPFHDDSYPIIGATDRSTAPNAPPFPGNIVHAWFPPALSLMPSTTWKIFTHTFTCGDSGAFTCTDNIVDPFGIGEAIGFSAQDGSFFCWASSMLHQVGNDNTSAPRGDLYCVLTQ